MLGLPFFLWKVSTIVGVCHIFLAFYPYQYGGQGEGVHDFKNPYKIINNKARLPIFSMEGIYNSGNMPHIFQYSIPFCTGDRGGKGFCMNSHNAKHTHTTHARNYGPRSGPNFQYIYIYTICINGVLFKFASHFETLIF